MIDKRIEYIDALRGLTMILVVFAHVEAYSFFGMQHTTFVGSVFQLFRMPLFFFISGLIAYRATPCKEKIFKKLRVQIFPATIFGLLYCHFNIYGFITDTAKAGYWFTYVLLEMFLIYYAISYIGYKLKDTFSNAFCKIIIIVAIILYVLRFPFKINPLLNEIGCITSTHYLFTYFHYFVFGLLASKYRDYFVKALDNKYIIGFAVVIFGLGSYWEYYTISPLVPNGNYGIYKILYEIIETICAYTGIIVLYNFFRKEQDTFNNGTKLGRGLSFIGRRTLDIYLLHYFILPSLPMIGAFLIDYPNAVLELCIGFSLSLLIVGICLFVSNIIRMSDFLSYWLFGTKKK